MNNEFLNLLYSGENIILDKKEIHKHKTNRVFFFEEFKKYLLKTNGVFVADDFISGSVFEKKQITAYIAYFVKIGHITKIKLSPKEIIDKMITDKIENFSSINSNRTCVFCGCGSFVIHKHHYPTKRKDGGEETIDMCPNCHYTYHAYECIYVINEKEVIE